ncbi:MAG: hypothetical protein ACYDH9_22280 [Limisphaerales bacterium]
MEVRTWTGGSRAFANPAPLKSRILWEQMLRRGTRRCDDINKSQFVVFDWFDGAPINYFKNVSSFDIEPARKTVLPRMDESANLPTRR